MDRVGRATRIILTALVVLMCSCGAAPSFAAPSGPSELSNPSRPLNPSAISEADINTVLRHLRECWRITPGREVRVLMKLKPDGMEDGEPIVAVVSEKPERLADTQTVEDLKLCQPFRLPLETYTSWKQLDLLVSGRGQ
jgi:hypothetical protein